MKNIKIKKIGLVLILLILSMTIINATEVDLLNYEIHDTRNNDRDTVSHVNNLFGRALYSTNNQGRIRMPGVKITLIELGWITSTDQFGGYAFSFVPPGVYTLKGEKHGFETGFSLSEVKVVAGKSSNRDVIMKSTDEPLAIFRGIITSAGKPVEGVEVVAKKWEGGCPITKEYHFSHTVTTYTDSNGRYNFPNLYTGAYRLIANKA